MTSVEAYGRRRIVSAVFPVSAYVYTQPTPQSTPSTQFTPLGQSFGGLPESEAGICDGSQSDPFVQQITWERAWHAATSFLRLPKDLALAEEAENLETLDFEWSRTHPSTSSEAINQLLQLGTTRADSDKKPDDTLIQWYANEVRRHFLQHTGPRLRSEFLDHANDETFEIIIRTVSIARGFYLFPFHRYVLPAYNQAYASAPDHTSQSAEKIVTDIQCGFEKDVAAMMTNFLPQGELDELLRASIKKEVDVILPSRRQKYFNDGDDVLMTDNMVTANGQAEDLHKERSSTQGALGQPPPEGQEEAVQDPDSATGPPEIEAARSRVINTFRYLERLGLGGGRSQRIFAEVMNEAMTRYVTESFRHQWQAPSKVTSQLRDWVTNHFARLAVEVLHWIRRTQESQRRQSHESDGLNDLVSLADVGKWWRMAVGRLGRLRITQLFDLVVEWDSSRGAIQDLKTYLGTPATRNHLISSFTSVLTRRLLHPGASTTEILQMYISLIRVFALLDPKGAVIERIARPIRRYLKDRADTVRVIVNGLLSKAPAFKEEHGKEIDAQENGDELVDLAIELYRANRRAALAEDELDFDWDDMNWTPDPIDAGPEFKKTRSADVIGTVMSLFDSKDVLIKEFQDVLGERLLQENYSLDQEVRVLELLKVRFGESSLQASEVMLRDVEESSVLNRNIQVNHDASLSPTSVEDTSQGYRPEMHAKILSRLFWPDLPEESFVLPQEIFHLQKQFEMGFEHIKACRKLTWLNVLGQVTVELSLDDRRVTENVSTSQASVIYAFHDGDHNVSSTSESEGLTRTVKDLATQLKMDEKMVRRALRFWVGKEVLQELSKDRFKVRERLDQAEGDAQESSVAMAMSTADNGGMNRGGLNNDDENFATMTKFKIFWQFILGMLTNGGPMALPQIATMLRFAVVGGFPFTEEELREYLNIMVQDEKLEFAGGKYKIVS